MKLNNLLSAFKYQRIKNCNQDLEVKDIAIDSRLVKKNYLFIAIPGEQTDGHNFIPQAIKNGARVIVVEDGKLLDSFAEDITVIYVKDTRQALADIAGCRYNYPSRKMKFIGITGTNGKTTVAYLLEQILQTAGFKTAVLGTVNYRFAGKTYKGKNTTPDSLTLQRYFRDMLRYNIDYVIMEVSSHALEQKRVAGIDFHCAIFTNFGSDHLDYHKIREEYFKAKLKLFKMLSSDSLAVINNDDAYAGRIIKNTAASVVTFGFKNSDIKAEKIHLNDRGAQFTVVNGSSSLLINTHLMGIHNVYNILSAVSCALKLGIKIKDIKRGVLNLLCVPGRLQFVDSIGSSKIFVDFAHTEDALKNAILSLKGVYKKSKLICVFGCGGDRDKTKRPKMGKIASDLADFVFITSDNPRTENPEDITADIVRGIKKDNFEVMLERKEAIRRSIVLAKTMDKAIVLIAGKGHEQYQLINNKRIPFADKKVVQKIIKSEK